MSDDIVDLQAIHDEFYGHEYDAVEELAFERAEIVRLRERVTELEAAVRAGEDLRDANRSHYAQEVGYWEDLADQLAEALRAVRAGELAWLKIVEGLAAYDRARNPETP